MSLQQTLEPSGWIEWTMLFVDMILQPILLLVWHVIGDPVSTFSICSTLLRSGELWWKWARYQVLRDLVRHWILVTKLFRGPFISCNDPQYHVFVYAEAIERLRLRAGSGLSHQSLGRISTSKEGLETRKHL